MGRIKGKYISTVSITLDADENVEGLIPYAEFELAWKYKLNEVIESVIRDELFDDTVPAKLEVTQICCDIMRTEDGEKDE